MEISDPTHLDNYGILYSKDIDGYDELHYMDNYGTTIQVTKNGYLATDGYSGVVQMGSISFVINNGLIINVLEN